jgi:hypothetical protein
MDPKPVFVSGSVWRRPVLRWCGIAVAILLAGYLIVVGKALLTTVETPPAQPSGESGPGGEEREPAPRRQGDAW